MHAKKKISPGQWDRPSLIPPLRRHNKEREEQDCLPFAVCGAKELGLRFVIGKKLYANESEHLALLR